MKKKRKFSLKYKVTILYLLLAIINSAFFSSMILENQMQLLAENTEYKATKFIESVNNSLRDIIATTKKMKSPIPSQIKKLF